MKRGFLIISGEESVYTYRNGNEDALIKLAEDGDVTIIAVLQNASVVSPFSLVDAVLTSIEGNLAHVAVRSERLPKLWEWAAPGTYENEKIEVISMAEL